MTEHKYNGTNTQLVNALDHMADTRPITKQEQAIVRAAADRIEKYGSSDARIEELEAAVEWQCGRAEKAEAELDRYKARAERAEGALVELYEVSKRAVRLSLGYDDFKLHAMVPLCRAIDKSHAALAQIDAEPDKRLDPPYERGERRASIMPIEPGPTLADAYRAGLKAAADYMWSLRDVERDHHDRGYARGHNAACLGGSRAICALEVPTEFGGE